MNKIIITMILLLSLILVGCINNETPTMEEKVNNQPEVNGDEQQKVVEKVVTQYQCGDGSFVMNKEDCPKPLVVDTKKEMEVSEISTKSSNSQNYVESESQFKSMSKEYCQDKWPSDFQMKAYCLERQEDGYDELLRSKPSGLTQEDYEIIKEHCIKKWLDDFQMRAYCEERQLEGYDELMSVKVQGMSDSDFQLIKNHCLNKWEKDFQMRAYCEERQLEGWKAIQ
jgi:hypothetical protein